LQKAVRHIVFLYIPVFTGMLLFSACGNTNEEIEALEKKEKMPLLISTEIVMEYSDSALLKARVTAPVLKEYGPPDNFTVLPKGIDVSFYSPSGKITSTLHADSAIIRRNSDLMEAYRNVVVKNEGGERLETDELVWRNSSDPSQRELFTFTFVKITKGDEVLFGEGLRANETFTRYKIIKPQGNFYISEENP
jgi:LPS export ABC transporter protein LptC